MPGTSHVATRPKKHTCERRICPSLSRPFAAGPASSLFVVVQSVLDVILTPVTTVVASPVASLYFLFFFVGWFFKKIGTRGNNIVCCCLLYFYLHFCSFSRFSLPKCMHQGRMVIALYQRSSLLPTIKWLCSCIHTSF